MKLNFSFLILKLSLYVILRLRLKRRVFFLFPEINPIIIHVNLPFISWFPLLKKLKQSLLLLLYMKYFRISKLLYKPKNLHSLKNMQPNLLHSNLCLITLSRLTTRINCNNLHINAPSRTMMSGRSIPVARAAYHCLSTLTNDDVINQTKKGFHKPLAETLLLYGLDAQKGVPQHKTSFMKHILNTQFLSTEIFGLFGAMYPNAKIEPNVLVDCRVLTEYAVLDQYLKAFGSAVQEARITCDSLSGNFPHQKQTNHDFWCTISTRIDQAMGLGTRTKCVPQDEKSGKNMFLHKTRGRIGLLTYENEYENIQIMEKPVTTQDIINYNEIRLTNIRNTMETDGILNGFFNYQLSLCHKTLSDSSQNAFEINKDIQNILWTNIQCHPDYNRSVSFVFTQHMAYHPFSYNQQNFANQFKSLLGDKLYDLNNNRDCSTIYKAMLTAYKSQVDPQVIEKLKYLHHETGVNLNVRFLQEFANIIQDGLFI